MAPPRSVSFGDQVVRALQTKNLASIELAPGARDRIVRTLDDPNDPITRAIASYGGVTQGRRDGERALVRFANLPDACVAVVVMRLHASGNQVDGVEIRSRDSYEAFGSLDEGTGGM